MGIKSRRINQVLKFFKKFYPDEASYSRNQNDKTVAYKMDKEWSGYQIEKSIKINKSR